jgi:uncharacterized cofD-like protein
MDAPDHISRSQGVTIPRVATIGGGHGQAMLVASLMRLRCAITAVVGVADDGGCSGRLREEMGMAPPGDIRRCLVAMATRPELAARFDERLRCGSEPLTRSAGNLVVSEMWIRLGSLQSAVDWAADLLGCAGRVVPIAETAGVLHAYDRVRGTIAGETKIERESANAIVVNVDGPDEAAPEAKRAVADADIVFIGPGSFVGSTLAALTTGDLGAAVVASRARRVLVKNLTPEADATFGVDDHERIVRDHLVIKSDGEAVTLDVLASSDEAEVPRSTTRSDGSHELVARLRRPGGATHDEGLVAAALTAHFGLRPCAAPRSSVADPDAIRRFEEVLDAARRRLSSGPA